MVKSAAAPYVCVSALRWALPIGAMGLVGCYEVDEGPHLDTPVPASNACLDLMNAPKEELQSPDGLLQTFDCLNSEGAFESLRSPLSYLVNETFVEAGTGQEMGYLDPYFFLGDYFAPLGLDEAVQKGDLEQTLVGLDTLLNDPSDPLGALLDVYVELYDQGHLVNLMSIGQVYAAYMYGHCTVDDCPFLEIANELYYSDSLAVLQESSAELAAQIDPELAADLSNDVLTVVDQTTSENSHSGQNLLLKYTEQTIVTPLADDPSRTVDDAYVAQSWTLLRALQQPLCQLRSDSETLDSFGAAGGSLGATGKLDYLPLYLRTLVNYNPDGSEATLEWNDAIDADLDGYSLADGDCNDANPAIHPGAEEIADDLIDNDCDLVPDFPLEDADQSCDRNKDGKQDACGPGDKYDPDCDNDCDGVSANRGDCDDTDPLVHPGLTIYGSDGSVVVIAPAEDPTSEESADARDNDCDGFVDRNPASLDLLLASVPNLLPMLYAERSEGESTLTYALGLLANQGAVDPEVLLETNGPLIEGTLSNLANNVIAPDVTARMREAFPVMSVLADMGLLTSTSTAGLKALNDDHEAYKEALSTAEETQSYELPRFSQYANACGESFDPYVDSTVVLTELVKVLDAYSVVTDPSLTELIRIVVNSDLLVDAVKLYPLMETDEATAEAKLEATLELFDYFLKPPEDAGLYFDSYDDARIWDMMPMAQLLFEKQEQVDAIDQLIIYALDGMEDPDSALAGVPAALEVLSQVDTGTEVDSAALTEALLSPDARPIILNMVAIAADPDFSVILTGNWDELSPAKAEQYQTEESVLAFTARWIEEGVISGMLDLAGDLVRWILDTTTLGDETSASSSPTPLPE